VAFWGKVTRRGSASHRVIKDWDRNRLASPKISQRKSDDCQSLILQVLERGNARGCNKRERERGVGRGERKVDTRIDEVAIEK